MSFGISAGAYLVAGAAVAGGAMAASATKSGMKAQAGAAQDANATSMAQYNQTREDQQPWMDRGNAAGNRLAMLLGIDTPQASINGSKAGFSESAGNFDANAYLAAHPEVADPVRWGGSAFDHYQQYGKGFGFAFTPTEQAVQDGQQQLQQTDAAKQDGSYGSLLRDFSQQDLDKDLVYQNGLQFGLDEGVKGVNRQAAATGSQLSGATLKALTRFGNDYGATKTGDAYNRFNTSNNNKFNMLSGVSGTGQTANSLVANSGANMANNVSQNQIGMGNARAASSIGQANALTGAIGQGYNMYQGNQLMNSMNTNNPNNASYWGGNQLTAMGGYGAGGGRANDYSENMQLYGV